MSDPSIFFSPPIKSYPAELKVIATGNAVGFLVAVLAKARVRRAESGSEHHVRF